MADLKQVKQRFEIIGSDPVLNRAIGKSLRVAATDISILVVGESGVGKEFIPKIIHSYSKRKHNPYIAVNCGAIPEGTIDSELFGHEKGAFTGATSTRKGYFEVVNGGTIFLDEVGELPLSTQVRLLRILETGEFIKVGSSQIQKTNVRLVAATNVNIRDAIQKNRFRQDLYYRLNTVEIHLSSLRERKPDIHLLFRKFASDFAEKYRMPILRLSPEAVQYIEHYPWPGNIRQLKNFAEQISVIELEREIDLSTVKNYLPPDNKTTLPILLDKKDQSDSSFANEREIMYKILFDMKKDLNDLKKLTREMIEAGGDTGNVKKENERLIKRVFSDDEYTEKPETKYVEYHHTEDEAKHFTEDEAKDFEVESIEEFEEKKEFEEKEETLSLEVNEIEMIRKALQKNKGRRKKAASELGISERTLYRKIKQYDL